MICGILCSLAQPERYLLELHRVMQPGAVVACAVQNFAHKLQADQGKPGRWLRMDGGRLYLQTIEYLTHPYRIRDSRHELHPASGLAQRFTAEHRDELTWRVVTELSPQEIPPDDVERVLYDEVVMYDPLTLNEALVTAGFNEKYNESLHLGNDVYVLTVAVA